MLGKTKVGTLNVPAATGEQTISGLPFRPQAIIFWYTSRTADGTSPNFQFGLGCTTSPSNEIAIGITADDNVVTADVGEYLSVFASIVLRSSTAVVLAADLVAFTADGFTLNWTTVTDGADVHYLALGGLTNALRHSSTLSALTGSRSATGLGFAPDAIPLVLTADTTSTLTNNSADRAMSFSAVGEDGSVASVAFGLDDNRTAAGVRRISSNAKFLPLPLSTATSMNGEATFTSFDADGYTYNIVDGYASGYLQYALCVQGARVAVGSLTVPAATGPQAISGLGFSPLAVLCFGTHDALSASVVTGGNVFFGGASGPTERAVVSSSYTHNSNPTAADHDSDTTKLIKAITAGTPTVDYAADLDSFDADGFTLDWTTIGTGGGTDQVLYVAIGSDLSPVDAAAAGSAHLDATAVAFRHAFGVASGSAHLDATAHPALLLAGAAASGSASLAALALAETVFVDPTNEPFFAAHAALLQAIGVDLDRRLGHAYHSYAAFDVTWAVPRYDLAVGPSHRYVTEVAGRAVGGARRVLAYVVVDFLASTYEIFPVTAASGRSAVETDAGAPMFDGDVVHVAP